MALTGADGLIPRPVYDGSSSGYKFVRDASVINTTAPCTIGWKVTTPAAGTKTETIYKKVIEKDVMTKTQLIADYTWWQKSTSQLTRSYAKIHELELPQERAALPGTHKPRARSPRTVISSRFCPRTSTKCSTATRTPRLGALRAQTPYTRATASRVEQKKYFYWYRNPAQGETDLKTTDKTVCSAFPSGCTLQGNDTWAVVQSCSATNGTGHSRSSVRQLR